MQIQRVGTEDTDELFMEDLEASGILENPGRGRLIAPTPDLLGGDPGQAYRAERRLRTVPLVPLQDHPVASDREINNVKERSLNGTRALEQQAFADRVLADHMQGDQRQSDRVQSGNVASVQRGSMQRAREVGNARPRRREDHSDPNSERLARNQQAWRQASAMNGSRTTSGIQRPLQAPTSASDKDIVPIILPHMDTEPLPEPPIYRIPGKPAKSANKPIKTGKPARRSWRIGNPIFLVLTLLLVLGILGVIGCDYLLSMYGGVIL